MNQINYYQNIKNKLPVTGKKSFLPKLNPNESKIINTLTIFI